MEKESPICISQDPPLVGYWIIGVRRHKDALNSGAMRIYFHYKCPLRTRFLLSLFGIHWFDEKK